MIRNKQPTSFATSCGGRLTNQRNCPPKESFSVARGYLGYLRFKVGVPEISPLDSLSSHEAEGWPRYFSQTRD